MALTNTSDGYGDSPKRRLPADSLEAAGQEANLKGLEIYDRKAEAEWQETFGIERKAHKRLKRQEQTAINLSDPYEADSGEPPQPTQRRERSRPLAEPASLAAASEDTKTTKAHGKGGEPPEKIPIREAMSTIRAIISRVKSGGAVGADDLSALGAAFDQLGAAALECKAAHNWPELKFIAHIRNLLGSYLGKTVPDAQNPLPRVELAEAGSIAGSFKGSARLPGETRFDLTSAGTLAHPAGAVGEPVASLPRVDIDMGGALAHTSGQTPEIKTANHVETRRVVMSEEPGRISSGSPDPGKVDLPLRMSTLEQIGVLISQREQAGKSVT